MIYSIIPEKYLFTIEKCFTQMVGCMLFIDKIRDDLAEELANAETDNKAIVISKHINDLTMLIEDFENLTDKIYNNFINHNLCRILAEKQIFKNTTWYKEISKANDGFITKFICTVYYYKYKIELCELLNRKFDLGLVADVREPDGTLNY